MLELEDSGMPDRNEPDHKVCVDSICLLYGFSEDNILNGKRCLVLEKTILGVNGYYPRHESWFLCHVDGLPYLHDIRADHLMHLDDSDHLVIEKLSKGQ